MPRIRKNYYFSRCSYLVSFIRVFYMWKKMKVGDFASVVTTSVTELTMALVVPASETVLIRRVMRRRLKEWRT